MHRKNIRKISGSDISTIQSLFLQRATISHSPNWYSSFSFGYPWQRKPTKITCTITSHFPQEVITAGTFHHIPQHNERVWTMMIRLVFEAAQHDGKCASSIFGGQKCRCKGIIRIQLFSCSRCEVVFQSPPARTCL